MIHNESINVWSHLMGVAFFIGLLVWTITCVNTTVDPADMANARNQTPSSKNDLPFSFDHQLI
jgi:hypothetical protein